MKVLDLNKMEVNKIYKNTNVDNAVAIAKGLGVSFAKCGAFRKWVSAAAGTKVGSYSYTNIFRWQGQPVVLCFCKMNGASMGAIQLVPVKEVEVDVDQFAKSRYGYIADYLI